MINDLYLNHAQHLKRKLLISDFLESQKNVLMVSHLLKIHWRRESTHCLTFRPKWRTWMNTMQKQMFIHSESFFIISSLDHYQTKNWETKWIERRSVSILNLIRSRNPTSISSRSSSHLNLPMAIHSKKSWKELEKTRSA